MKVGVFNLQFASSLALMLHSVRLCPVHPRRYPPIYISVHLSFFFLSPLLLVLSSAYYYVLWCSQSILLPLSLFIWEVHAALVAVLILAHVFISLPLIYAPSSRRSTFLLQLSFSLTAWMRARFLLCTIIQNRYRTDVSISVLFLWTASWKTTLSLWCWIVCCVISVHSFPCLFSVYRLNWHWCRKHPCLTPPPPSPKGYVCWCHCTAL